MGSVIFEWNNNLPLPINKTIQKRILLVTRPHNPRQAFFIKAKNRAVTFSTSQFWYFAGISQYNRHIH